MKPFVLLLLLIINFKVKAQTITGNLVQHSGQTITLTGFNYYQNYQLAIDTIDTYGNFELKYPETYKGMAILNTQDNSSLVLVATESIITLNGTHLTETDSLVYIQGSQNNQYLQYAKTKSERDAAYMALKYLEPLYKGKKELQSQKQFAKAITNEIKRLEQADATFLNTLDKTAYLHWFIPMKQLIQDMPVTYNRYTERIPQNIAQFRNIDFNDPNFKTSGLFRELIEGHYMLLENSGGTLEEIYDKMNFSTNYLINNLKVNDSLLNIATVKLFNYFEKRSLFKASEYLSLQLLKENNQCSLQDNVRTKLEAYNKLKIGAIAPEIQLTANKKLSEIETNKLLVFGASWCPSCKDDTLKLLNHYKDWKEKGIEIVYISVDTDKIEFEGAYSDKPWKTYCDYKGWDTQAAQDYNITGTPTYFLLDKDNTILARPNSVVHANLWIM
ncbi:hypothetical protein GCM10023314_05610 [Algibacter agarivorans]|uniref:Thioredoxin domain-containing protein n=1 Tax=Algibacter agarivorans TaxID=1109741 RepID=A0ABP9GI14_9FLAO